MGTLITVHSTKLLYATILKGLALWEQIRFRRQIIADMLPQIATQWDAFTKVISPCISRKVAITASLSKSADVPDETRVPPQVEMNTGAIRLMRALATDMGLTLNETDYVWFDEEQDFRQAFETWPALANALLEIEQLAADLTMHRAFAADLYTDQTEQRTPGQLTFYSECDIPLADSIFSDKLNRAGLRDGLGALYLGWMMAATEALVNQSPPSIETDQAQVSAAAEDDPDNPGTKTVYRCEAPAGWKLGGVVIAAAPNLGAAHTFYTSTFYGSATAGGIRIDGAYDGPHVPEAMEIQMLLIRSV